MTVTLIVRNIPRVGVEAEAIRPDVLEGKTATQIQRTPIWAGRRKMTIGDVFDVQLRESDEPCVEILGDASRVKRIGQGMELGEIRIRGNAGMHLGAHMSGGSIQVWGSVSSWCGAEMTGGSIEIHGSAGHYLGGAYRGSFKGMQGGCITVHGRCGSEVGAGMAGGRIAVSSAGPLAGVGKTGGLIRISGPAGPRAGLGLKGGTIVIDGETYEPIPGAFYQGVVDSGELGIDGLSGRFLSFRCDMAERKQGLLLISEAENLGLAALLLR